MLVGDVAPELVLLVGAVSILIFALFAPRRVQRWAAALALAILVIAAVATAHLAQSVGDVGRFTFSDTYAVDGAAVWGKFIILGATAIVISFSVDWFATDPRHGEYYSILLMAALGAVLMAGASDIMELTLAMLLSSVTGYVLVAYHRRSKRAGEAALKYYLLGALANGAMMYGIVLLFGLTATTTYSRLLIHLARADSLPLIAAVGLVIVGLAFKMGAVPVHAWMPDVADGAPVPVAAFVTGIPKIGALIALARFVILLPESGVGWRSVIALLAAVTMTLGNAAALWQDDVRRLLGWSAVSQTGYGLMAVVALGRSALAIPSLLFFLVAYTLANLAAFGVVAELRGEAKRMRYAGLARTHPLLAAALVVSFLSFVGIPPLAGFGAKLALFGAVIDAGYGWLAIVAIINTVVSLAYYGRVLGPAYFGLADAAAGSKAAEVAQPLSVLGRWAEIGTGASALALIVLGVGAEMLLVLFRSVHLLPH